MPADGRGGVHRDGAEAIPTDLTIDGAASAFPAQTVCRPASIAIPSDARMGVPVVTLVGERHAARGGASLLSAAGFAAGIAGRAEDYVTIARLLAEQPQLLVAVRGNLRAEIARSPLCDAAGHARALEEAYRAIWHIWCEA